MPRDIATIPARTFSESCGVTLSPLTNTKPTEVQACTKSRSTGALWPQVDPFSGRYRVKSTSGIALVFAHVLIVRARSRDGPWCSISWIRRAAGICVATGNPLSVSVGTESARARDRDRCAKLIVAAHLVMYTRAYHHLPLRSIPVLTS